MNIKSIIAAAFLSTRSRVAAGAMLLSLTACVSAPAFADPLADQVFSPEVKLDLGGGTCSGTVISSEREKVSGKVATIVLTAKHCVLDTKDTDIIKVVVEDHDKTNRPTKSEEYFASLLGKSYKSDLALLRLRDKDTVFIKTAVVAPKDITLNFAQEVVVVGYPKGQSLTYTKGNLGFVEDGYFPELSNSGEFYRATPDIAPGNSGGGMFTQNGTGAWELIGVTTGAWKGFSFMNLFTPIEEINDYLDVAKTTYAWPVEKTEDQKKEDVKKTEIVSPKGK